MLLLANAAGAVGAPTVPSLLLLLARRCLVGRRSRRGLDRGRLARKLQLLAQLHRTIAFGFGMRDPVMAFDAGPALVFRLGVTRPGFLGLKLLAELRGDVAVAALRNRPVSPILRSFD